MQWYRSSCPDCGRSYSWIGYKTGLGKTYAQLNQMCKDETTCKYCGSTNLKTGLNYDNEDANAFYKLAGEAVAKTLNKIVKEREERTMTTTTRVRYGRNDDNAPKNTLVTVRTGDTIYFGISRCRLPADRPNKEEGKRRAQQRADIAASGVAGAWTIDGSFYLHTSGLFGQVNFDEMPKLLSYFDNVDTVCKERAAAKSRGK